LTSTIKMCDILSVGQGSTVHQGKGGANDDHCQEKLEPVPEKREQPVQENNEEGQDIMVSHASRLDVIRQRERPCNFEQGFFLSFTAHKSILSNLENCKFASAGCILPELRYT
jgi:hypothetical protein